MARPKNNEHKQKIAVAAYGLFFEKGYNKTSYSDIAKASNNTNGIVQHYYPKKENLILDLLSKQLELIEEYIKEKSLVSDDPHVNMFMIGQIYYNFQINYAKAKLLSIDIFESRKITHQVFLLNDNWTYKYMELPEEEKINQAFISEIAIGGAYEIGYRALVNNETIDINKLLRGVFHSFMAGFGIDETEINTRLAGHDLSDEILLDSSDYLLKNILISKYE